MEHKLTIKADGGTGLDVKTIELDGKHLRAKSLLLSVDSDNLTTAKVEIYIEEQDIEVVAEVEFFTTLEQDGKRYRLVEEAKVEVDK